MKKEDYQKFLDDDAIYKLGNREHIVFRFPYMRGVLKFSFSKEGYPEARTQEIDRVSWNYYKTPADAIKEQQRNIEKNTFRIMVNSENPEEAFIYLFALSDQGTSVNIFIESEPEIGKERYGAFEKSLPFTEIISPY